MQLFLNLYSTIFSRVSFSYKTLFSYLILSYFLFPSWADVEDPEETVIDNKNEMEIKIFSENLYNNSYAFLEDIRGISALELQSLRDQATASTHFSKWKLYQSIALIIFVLICVAPPIVYLTVKTTLSGMVWIIGEFGKY